MKKYVLLGGILIIALLCFRNIGTVKIVEDTIISALSDTEAYIDPVGETIATRVRVPEGYTRVTAPKHSFQDYIQHYPLKADQSPIINYDGSTYIVQHWHDAILDLPVPDNGLQQCADALIRIRAEYLWRQKRKDEIGFNFTSGHYCSWKKYAAGYRPKVHGNQVSFHKTANANHTKANFYKYLNLIFMYAGTLSLYTELPKIEVTQLQIGDMVVDPGTPGHIEMIVDHAVNDQGDHIYLIAQGNTPAQSVCVLKNFEEKNYSPWYHLSQNQAVYTPSYHFDTPTYIRFKAVH